MISLPLPIRLFLCTLAAAVLPCLPARALTVETLKAFPQGPMNPSGGLVIGPDGAFYGTTEKGGSLGGGVFYKTLPSGELTVLHQFVSAEGTMPSGGLLLASDGNFYGGTRLGGNNAKGTLYRITPQGVITVLRHLDTASGSALSGAMIQDADGTLHGNMTSGGANGQGVVFSIKMDGTAFSNASLSATTGYNPNGSLVVRPDGIYGVATRGGTSDHGTVFKRSASGTVQIFKELNSSVARFPRALVFAGDGNFYGIGYKAGLLTTDPDTTIVFRMTPAGVFSSHSSVSNVGSYTDPVSLEVGADGNLYGYGHGMASYYRFSLSGYRTAMGTAPSGLSGRPLHAPDGSIYATTKTGSNGDNGCILKFLTGGTSEVITSFVNEQGTSPAALLELPDGTLVGRTTVAPADGSTSFRITQEGKFSTIPFLPSGPLAIGPDQSLYGIASGNFYRADLSKGKFSLQVPLLSGNTGTPGLCLASDGNFYGSTSNRLWKLTPAGVQTVIATVSNHGSAWSPESTLTEGADGMLYGVTYWGGSSSTSSGYAGVGTVFRSTKDGQVTILKHFDETTGAPRLPLGKLVRHPDGNLYGMTALGGTPNNGTVFRIAPNGAYTQVAQFGTSPYRASNRGLVLGKDNALYGISEGTGSDPSIVFRVTTAGVFSQAASLAEFNVNGMSVPLMAGSDGNLYGLASGGGTLPDGSTAGGGAVFRVRYGPAPKTTSVTQVGNETATFQGTVDPRGLLTTASFQWATKPDFSDMQAFPAGTVTTTEGIKTFTLDATGLPRSTKLYARMAASNSENTITQVGDSIQFTTFPLPADIAIEDAAGVALEENAITDIGGTTGLRAATYTFTVRNKGQVDLTNTQITITGGASEFAVVSQPASVIPGGGTSTFTISMLPSSNGAKAGTFRVESSDRYRNPVSFGVTGTGFTLSTVNFATATTVPATVTSLNATGLQLGQVSIHFEVSATTTVTLINNTGTSPVQGHFDSLPEGTFLEVPHYPFPYSQSTFKISYVGGDGNDVVLIRTRPPSLWLSAPAVTNTTAAFSPSVSNFGQQILSLKFEYGYNTSYGSTADLVPIGPSQPSQYSVRLENLNAGTIYYCRLTITTTDGTATELREFGTNGNLSNLNFPTPDHAFVTTPQFHPSGNTVSGPLQLGFVPSPNQTLMLVKQTGTQVSSSTFYNLPQGTVLALDAGGQTLHFAIRYDGGDGNDIVLTRTYPKENARYVDAKLGESFFYSYRIYNSEFTMTGVPSWLVPSRSADYLNFYGTPTAKGIHRITVTLTGNSTPVVIIVNVLEPAAQWKGRHFTPQEIADPNVSGNLADASGNGISNLMKYALGIPPKSNDTGNLPKQSLQKALDEDYLTLTYIRDRHVEGIDYIVEVSDGLGSWQSGPLNVVEASRTPNPDGTETVVVWDVNPVKSSKSRFMRLKVTD